MAFFSKAGNILRQTVSNQINREVSACNPSIFQAIRCMSSSKVFVGGLAWATDEHGLKEAFSKYGEVVEAKVITDHESGRSRGFGFVTYASPEDASSAIQALDGQELHGRNVRVNFANERARGGGGGFGGGGYGGGGGGYGGGGGGYGGGSGGYGGGGSNYGGGGSYGGDNNYGRSGGGYGGSGGGYGGSGGGYGGDSLSGNGSFGSPSDNISGPPAGFSGGDQYDNSIGNINNDAGQFEETFVNDDEQPSDYEKRA